MKKILLRYWTLYLIAIGFFIAIFSPENILDQFPALQNMTHPMKSIFPPIAGYSKRSQFPQVSEFYFAYMWLLSPFYFWVSLKLIRNDKGLKNWKPKNLGDKLKNIFTGVLLASSLSFFVLFINPGYDFNLLPINSSRLALGIAGVAFSGCAAAFMLAVAYAFLEKFRQK